jgi:hypothetical protein
MNVKLNKDIYLSNYNKKFKMSRVTYQIVFIIKTSYLHTLIV